MNKLVLTFGGSTLVYAGLAWLMGIWPGVVLSRIPPGRGVIPLTALQAEGRDVYVANGCSYCHTQQVRPLDQDKGFGRPSAEGDFAYQTPELLGSERTGPDLTNIGARQPSAVWHYIHLYNPRAVVPESIMPSFSWLFAVTDRLPAGSSAVPVPKAHAPTHGVVVPTHQAEALIAYLASLRQPSLTSPESSSDDAPAPAEVGGTRHGGSPGIPSGSTSIEGSGSATGVALFTANCAACHQANGEGLPGAFPPLKGDSVVNDVDATTHISVILRGLHDSAVGGMVYASAMPSFSAALSDSEIAAIINFERGSWGNHGKPTMASQVALERTKSP